MRSSRVWGLAERRAGKRVVKSMLGKCCQICACERSLCCQSLWEGVMELRLVTSYSPPLPPSADFSYHHHFPNLTPSPSHTDFHHCPTLTPITMSP